MKTVLLFLTLSLTACASYPTSQGTSTRVIHSKWDPRVSSAIRINSEATPTGSNYSFNEVPPNAKILLGEKLVGKIQDSIRKFLNARGFKEVKESRKAHLGIMIVANETVSDNKTRLDRMAYSLQVSSYNVRPKDLVTGWVDIIGATWDEVAEDVIHNIEFRHESVPPWPTVYPPEGKGDPGCFQRMGYFEEPVYINREVVSRVWKVPPQSAAADAGLKVGDIVLAVDSQDVKLDSDVYKGIKVPIKLKRGEKIVRSTIGTKLTCDH